MLRNIIGLMWMHLAEASGSRYATQLTVGTSRMWLLLIPVTSRWPHIESKSIQQGQMSLIFLFHTCQNLASTLLTKQLRRAMLVAANVSPSPCMTRSSSRVLANSLLSNSSSPRLQIQPRLPEVTSPQYVYLTSLSFSQKCTYKQRVFQFHFLIFSIRSETHPIQPARTSNPVFVLC